MEEKKNGRGGYRPNAGRPKKKEEDKLQRTAHAIRAFEDEWKLIQRFINLVRKDKVKCEQAIKLLEMKWWVIVFVYIISDNRNTKSIYIK